MIYSLECQHHASTSICRHACCSEGRHNSKHVMVPVTRPHAENFGVEGWCIV